MMTGQKTEPDLEPVTMYFLGHRFNPLSYPQGWEYVVSYCTKKGSRFSKIFWFGQSLNSCNSMIFWHFKGKLPMVLQNNGPHSRKCSEVSSEMFLKGFSKTTYEKDIRQIHESLKKCSYAAEVFWAVLPGKSFLKSKASESERDLFAMKVWTDKEFAFAGRFIPGVGNRRPAGQLWPASNFVWPVKIFPIMQKYARLH